MTEPLPAVADTGPRHARPGKHRGGCGVIAAVVVAGLGLGVGWAGPSLLPASPGTGRDVSPVDAVPLPAGSAPPDPSPPAGLPPGVLRDITAPPERAPHRTGPAPSPRPTANPRATAPHHLPGPGSTAPDASADPAVTPESPASTSGDGAGGDVARALLSAVTGNGHRP